MTSSATFGGMGETDTEFAMRLAQKDPKTAVNQFCQRYCHRPVTKEDITYTVQRYPGGYQATVKLNCIEGQEFAGELAPTQKDAEKNASNQVLAFYQDQINSMPKQGGAAAKKKKRPADTMLAGAAKMPCLPGEADPNGALNPAQTFKSELHTTCSKIVRRVIQKNEVVYETHKVVGGFQATVTCPGLPDAWGQQIWAGEVMATQKDAEQSAAMIALEAVRADPALMASYNAPPKPKNWSPFQGKGRGRGVAKGGKGLQVNASAANQWNAAAAAGTFGGLSPW